MGPILKDSVMFYSFLISSSVRSLSFFLSPSLYLCEFLSISINLFNFAGNF